MEAERQPVHRAYGDPRFPFILTTYRLTEHHTGGGMSRWLPWLSELQPEPFCEVSPELARLRGLEHAGWATITTARGAVEARVLVTERMRPLVVRGATFHTVGLPYHWGWVGRVQGDPANELIAFVADPNVQIMETKALTADIRPGRRDRGRRVAALASGEPVPRDVARDLPGIGQPSPTPKQVRKG